MPKSRKTTHSPVSPATDGGAMSSGELAFPQLVELCRSTHQSLQVQAYRAIDNSTVLRNWLFGCYIVEFEQKGVDRAEYGQKLLAKLSASLTEKLGKGFSKRSLEIARKFYLAFPEIAQTLSAQSLKDSKSVSFVMFDAIQPTLSVESISSDASISATLSRKSEKVSRISSNSISDKLMPIRQTLSAALLARFRLGWSHYVTLLSISNPDERSFYEIETEANGWSVRELERQIGSSLYERLALSRDKEGIRRLAREGQIVENPADLFKSPLVLEFLGLKEHPSYSEAELESAIIDKLQDFLLELGKGFLFEARQKRFSFDNDHYFVDLVFYNRLLRCYVLIDLKRDKLSHQDLGQMQMYVNYFDRFVKTADENPTVGIVLCHRKNDALVELTLPKDANIFASKYQLYLPAKEELKAALERFEHELEGHPLNS